MRPYRRATHKLCFKTTCLRNQYAERFHNTQGYPIIWDTPYSSARFLILASRWLPIQKRPQAIWLMPSGSFGKLKTDSCNLQSKNKSADLSISRLRLAQPFYPCKRANYLRTPAQQQKVCRLNFMHDYGRFLLNNVVVQLFARLARTACMN